MEDMATKKEEKKMYGKYEKWEVESWANTIVEAEQIKANPEKMKYVAQCLGKKQTATKRAIESIEDLRSLAKAEKESDSYEEYDESEG